MAGGVNIKMGVTGVAQFKQNINTAKQQIKTMNADLALIEKQFKASGDAETYMQQKTEVLKAKLEEQKNVLNQTEQALQKMKDNGVTAASAAFQEMQRQVLAAKGDLIDTEQQLAGVSNSADDAENNVSGMNAQLKRIGDGVSVQNVVQGLDKITGGLEKAAKKAINFAKQIAGAMIDAGSWADDLHTRAMNYGVTDEQLQRMEKTSRIIDTSVEAIVSSQKKLRLGLGKEDKEAMGGLLELLGEGYDPRGKDWETVFWDAGEALMKFTDAEEKEVYAQKLFGRSWQELIPLFTAGREEYEKTNESWKVVSQESIDKLTAMDDEYQKLMANWDTFKHEALSQFAEPMQKAMETINVQLGKFTEWLSSDEGQKFVGSVVDTMQKALEWIMKPENIQGVIDAVKAMVAGWAGLKLIGGGAQILQLVTGAKALLGGGKGATDTVTAGSGGSNLIYSGAGAKAASAASKLQLGAYNAAPVMDWLLNNTAIGRQAQNKLAQLMGGEGRFGDEDIFGGLKQNISTFGSDWSNNAIVGSLISLGENQIRYWNGRAADWRLMEENTHGDDWTVADALADAQTKAAEQTADLTGATEAEQKATKSLENASDNMRNLPAEMRQAVIEGMGAMSINIDGQSAGSVLAPYVGGSLGLMVLNNP